MVINNSDELYILYELSNKLTDVLILLPTILNFETPAGNGTGVVGTSPLFVIKYFIIMPSFEVEKKTIVSPSSSVRLPIGETSIILFLKILLFDKE